MISPTPPPTEPIGRNSAPSPVLRPMDSLGSIDSIDSIDSLDSMGNTGASRIRTDITSMSAYAIQDATGMVKLDAMENPYRLSEELQTQLGARLGAVASLMLNPDHSM